MRDLARIVQHCLGEQVRDVVLADHDLDIHTKVVWVAEYFEDAAAGLPVQRRPLGDLDIDDQVFEIVRMAERSFGMVGIIA